MPNIRSYNSPVDGLQPTETGVQAVAGAARRIGSSFNEAAEAVSGVGNQMARNLGGAVRDAGEVVVKYAEHREISQGAAELAKTTDALTRRWNETAKNADPNDPTVAAKFREEVLEPTIQKMTEGFVTEGGQNWARGRAESLRNHVYTKTDADMATLAEVAVGVNFRQTSNTLTNTAMNDPSAVPHLIETIDSSVGAMVDTSPNLRGAAAAKARMALSEKAKEDIVKAGAIGAIQRAGDPEAEAQRWGERYPQFINGADLKILSANARQQIRADRIDATYREHQAEKATTRASDTREVEYLQSLHSDDPNEVAKVSTKAIVNDPLLNRTAKERMINIVNREMKPETAAQVSNRNAVDMLRRLRLPDGDPERITDLNPIYDARINEKLNRTDFDMLRKEFTEVRTPEGERLSVRKNEFMKAVSPSIDKSNPLMGTLDKDGKLNSYRLMVDLDRKIDEYRKAGKNPYDLLDPSKPDYMGAPAALQPYQKPLQDSIRDQARRLTGGSVNLTGPGKSIISVDVQEAPVPKIEPRKPGESPADYLKRTGR